MYMEDCYFIISQDQTITAICLSCNEKKEGFYWQGSRYGYGINNNITCSVCNKTIYKEKDDDQNNI